jgi:small subunit ribosomal protein S16
MVKIRLSRGGAKKRAFFPIVVTNSRAARDAQSIERLGFFNPIATSNEERIRVDMERFGYWVSKGAQVSERVSAIIKEAKAGPEAARAQRQAKSLKRKAVKERKKTAAAEPAASDAAPAA